MVFLQKLKNDDFIYLDETKIEQFSRQHHAKAFEGILIKAISEVGVDM